MMTAVDAVEQTRKAPQKQHGHDASLDRRRIRMGRLQIHTQGATRLPKRLRQIRFAVITHDVSGAITGDASALECGGINVGPKHLSG
jgi:hypothetical protein